MYTNEISKKYQECNNLTRMILFPFVYLLSSVNTIMSVITYIVHFTYLFMQLAILVLIVYIYWNRNQGIWTFSFEYFNTPFGDIRTGAQYNPVPSSVCSTRNTNFISGESGIMDHVSRFLSLTKS